MEKKGTGRKVWTILYVGGQRYMAIYARARRAWGLVPLDEEGMTVDGFTGEIPTRLIYLV